MKINTIFKILFLCLVVKTFAQKRPDRFDGVAPAGTVNVITGTGFESKTIEVNNLIKSFDNSGGNIQISGDISLRDIKLKSNVHVNVLKGSVIKLENGGKTVFDLNKRGTQAITNVKISCNECTDDFNDNKNASERFTIDISSVEPDENARAMIIANVTNYSVSHFIIKDNFTRLTAIATLPVFNVPEGDEPKFRKNITVLGAPRKGDLKYVHLIDGHSGYGLVQTQAGQNLNFHYLSAEGGIALRLESGASISDVPATKEPLANLDNIEGYEIKCERGLCALLTQPHNRTQGTVTIENIESIGCAANIIMAPGFKDRSLIDLPEEEYGCETCEFKNGTFEEVILKGTIKHTFASTAQIESKLYNFYTNNFIAGESFADKFSDPKFESPFPESIPVKSNAPSIANILYRAKSADDIDVNPVDGQYSVRFVNENIITDNVPSLQSCIGDILFFNDRKLRCETLSSTEVGKDVGAKVYYNIEEQSLFFNNTIFSNVKIYNVVGVLVKDESVDFLSSKIDLTDLKEGVYVGIADGHSFKFVKN